MARARRTTLGRIESDAVAKTDVIPGERIARDPGPTVTVSLWVPALRGAAHHLAGMTVLPHRLVKVLVDLIEEAFGGEVFLFGADERRQILGHEPRFHRIDAHCLQS